MNMTRQRLAAIVAFSYIAVMLGGILTHFMRSGDLYTLKFSLLLPSTLIALLLASILVWGLWKGLRWAWWLGLAASILQLVRMSTWLSHRVSQSGLPSPSVLLVFAILLGFLILLLLPGTRSACVR